MDEQQERVGGLFGSDLVIRGREVVDPAGRFRAPLTHLFFQPMFISAIKTFEPFIPLGPRITVGRTVLPVHAWPARAADRPAEASGIRVWADDRGRQS